ncbi:MAG: molybdopterin-dependent oxidoreductase [Chloroflexi bacterium]|nr:molybdopterin-dependent oxidoreductase [Chloroflexota bacterium]
MKSYSVIGKRVPRVDGGVKATGEARYASDLGLAGLLHGRILRSPYPHARIIRIDTRRAERLPGVKAVLTGKDLAEADYSLELGAEPAVAIDKVRYAGEGVAAVAATGEDIAEEALGLIEVEYEELPPVLNAGEALKEGAPRVHETLEKNMAAKLLYNFGDVQQGFRESSYVREDRFTTQGVHGCYLEPLISAASFDSQRRLMVWSTTQGTGRLRNTLAATLRMRQGDVRVVGMHMGGGHCGKTRIFPQDLCAALLSRKAERPVKIELSREEAFILNRGAQPTAVELKTGVRADGRLVAIECKLVADTGAYFGGNLVYGYTFGTCLLSAYRLPHFRYQGYLVTTNSGPCQAQRGSGATPARFVIECQLDIIAADLKLDPVELRLKNALRSGDTTINKSRVSGCGLSDCIQRTAEAADWKNRKGKLPPGRGIGIAAYAHPTAGSNTVLPSGYSSAFVHVHQDGAVTLVTGANEIGQGSSTVLCQIVAEELGVDIKDIRISLPDTEVTPFDWGSMGSRTTFLAGNAVKAAAADARRQVFELAAGKLGVTVDELEAAGGQIYVRRSPEKRVPFTAIARVSQLAGSGKPILGSGSYCAEDITERNWETGEGDMGSAFSSGAVVAEVEVDKETGRVTVSRVTLAHDCGLALNPMAVEGQIEGQIQAAAGQAICEERLTQKGVLLNPSFVDYKMLSATDMPQVIPVIVETVDTSNPLGVKECGEGPQGGIAPAIANAVYDAIGVRINDLPITPQKVLDALKERMLKGTG